MQSVVVKDTFSPALKEMASQIKDTRLPNRQLSVKLYGWVIRNFNSSGGLDKPWRPLAPATLREKIKKGYSRKPLFRTGNLRNSFEPFSDSRVAGVGARASFDVNYAIVHQEGTAHIPARPMLPPVKVLQSFALEVYGKFVENTIEGH